MDTKIFINRFPFHDKIIKFLMYISRAEQRAAADRLNQSPC